MALMPGSNLFYLLNGQRKYNSSFVLSHGTKEEGLSINNQTFHHQIEPFSLRSRELFSLTTILLGHIGPRRLLITTSTTTSQECLQHPSGAEILKLTLGEFIRILVAYVIVIRPKLNPNGREITSILCPTLKPIRYKKVVAFGPNGKAVGFSDTMEKNPDTGHADWSITSRSDGDPSKRHHAYVAKGARFSGALELYRPDASRKTELPLTHTIRQPLLPVGKTMHISDPLFAMVWITWYLGRLSHAALVTGTETLIGVVPCT
ncbi:hypothetical protein PM082_004427 [Marasmius tenuissimus]|nr:hypothetical protein PM082_004427 [Marasmius tenuissimus]